MDTPGDGLFGNGEMEGTLAVGGDATFGGAGGGSGSYPIFQGGVGGSADYGVPVIDGDINRVLINAFALPAADAPQRVAQVQVRVDGTPPAGAKIVDLDTPENYELMPAYDSGGTTFSLAQSAGGSNLSPQLSSAPQTWDGSGDSFRAADAFVNYLPADTGATILANATYVTPAITVGGEASVTIDPTGPNMLQLTDFGAAAKFSMTGYTVDAPLVIDVAPSDVVDGYLHLPSDAVAGKDGSGANYVLFDMSALTGDVAVVSRGGEPVRGSLYAPSTHVIFPPEGQGGVEFEGQVIAADFTALQGGKEIHTNLFAGLLPCGDTAVGGFSLQKELAGGIDATDLPADTAFEVTASWTLDGTSFEEVYELPADGALVEGAHDLPVGTEVTFSEVEAADVAGWSFEGVSFSPDAITIAASGNEVVTATNTYAPVGGFSSQKDLTGVDAADIPADLSFRVLAVWVSDSSPHLEWYDVPASGDVILGAQDIPVGTTVTFFERTNVEIEGYDFDGASYSERRIVIGQGENPTIVATNDYLEAGETGGFSLRKELVGIDASDLPPGASFEITATWSTGDGVTEQLFDVPADGTEVEGP